MNPAEKLSLIWQKLSIVQRALLAAILVTCVLTAGLLTKWAGKPDMRLLYQGLSAEEAGKITDKINEKGIQYELRGGGTSIYVPSENVYQLRLDLAKEGLPSPEQGGFKVFDNEKIGISPFVQNINYMRALQEELAKSIQMIDGVTYVRVHIVKPEQSLLNPVSDSTTASVVLKLKPGFRIGSATIVAIGNLISGSVEGLKIDNVIIVDSTGRLLSTKNNDQFTAGANSFIDYKERVEQNLTGKVQEMLEAVLGPGRSSVKISAEIDMTSINLTKKVYDPQKVPIKEEINSTSKTAGTAQPEDKSKQASNAEKEEKITTEYVVSESTSHQFDVPGKIKFLSVSAVVDLSAPISASADPNKPAQTAEMMMSIEQVEALIRNALGLKETDSLKVVNTTFYHPAIEIADSSGYEKWARYVEFARQGSVGILAICALVALKIFTGGSKNISLAAGGKQVAGGSGEIAGLLGGGETTMDTALLRKQIASVFHQNPDAAKQLFVSWLGE